MKSLINTCVNCEWVLKGKIQSRNWATRYFNLLQDVPFHLQNALLFYGKNKSNYKTKPIALIFLAWQQHVLVPEDLFNGQTLWTLPTLTLYFTANYLVIHFNLGIATDWEWGELNVQVERHIKRDGMEVGELSPLLLMHDFLLFTVTSTCNPQIIKNECFLTTWHCQTSTP